MKCSFSFFFFLISLSAYGANCTDPVTCLADSLQVVTSLNDSSPEFLCLNPEPDSTSKPYCEDFYSYACTGSQDKKPTPENDRITMEASTLFIEKGCPLIPGCGSEQLEPFFNPPADSDQPKEVMVPFLGTMISTAFESNFAAAAHVVGETEQLVYKKLNPSQEEMQNLFSQEKNRLLSIVRSMPLKAAKKLEIEQKLNLVKLLNSEDSMKAVSKFVSPNDNERGMEFAYNAYFKVCGPMGISGVNAFTGKGDFIHLCPGKILNTLTTHGKEIGLRNLSISFSHELSHTLLDLLPEMSEEIQTCFNAHSGYSQFDGLTDGQKRVTFSRQKGEIIPDLWSAESLSNQIRDLNLSGENVAKVVSSSLQEYCYQSNDQSSGNSYPGAKMRISFYGNHPSIRAAMGCVPPTQEAPTCTASGRIPANPTPD